MAFRTRSSTAFMLAAALVIQAVGSIPTSAQELIVPAPGRMVSLSAAANPPVLKGIKVRLDDPLHLDFILDTGSTGRAAAAEGSRQLVEESTRLVKYFLAGLTVPERDLWVNLSPYERDRIIPAGFGSTEMGRDLLAQDYLLKQITASLLFPEGETGKSFWARVYAEAGRRIGRADVPVSTFNKVWIVPEKAVVYENTKSGTAYVLESKLKVMLEGDYLAAKKNHQCQPVCQANEGLNAKADQGSKLTQTIIREIIIPLLNKEVNEGGNFARLRQVYNSLILAHWYKKKLRDSVLASAYADKGKVQGTEYAAGAASSGRSGAGGPEQIYERYLEAFKKGVYNYVKEELDPVTRQTVPRKYFSGGVQIAPYIDQAMATVDRLDPSQLGRSEGLADVAVGLAMAPGKSALSKFTPEHLRQIHRYLHGVLTKDYRLPLSDQPRFTVDPEIPSNRFSISFRMREEGGGPGSVLSVTVEYDFSRHVMTSLNYIAVPTMPKKMPFDKFALVRMALLAAWKVDPQFTGIALTGWTQENAAFLEDFFSGYDVHLHWEEASEDRPAVVSGTWGTGFLGVLASRVVRRFNPKDAGDKNGDAAMAQVNPIRSPLEGIKTRVQEAHQGAGADRAISSGHRAEEVQNSFSGGIDSVDNAMRVEDVRRSLDADGLRDFVPVQAVQSRHGERMTVYQHPDGLRIIKKSLDPAVGNGTALRRLAQAQRHSIVPIFYGRDPNVYYELDLRGLGYVSLSSMPPGWMTPARKERIQRAVREGLRYDSGFWFYHGHLHGGNILLKMDEEDNIEDVRIIDFKYVNELSAEGNSALKELSAGRTGVDFTGQDVSRLDLDWLDLRGARFDGMHLSRKTFIGSDLSGASFARAVLTGIRFKWAILDGVSLEGAELSNVSFEGIGVFRRVNFTGARLFGPITIGTLAGVDLYHALLGAGSIGALTEGMSRDDVRDFLAKMVGSSRATEPAPDRTAGETSDSAMAPGGIDLTADRAQTVTAQKGAGIRLHFDPAMYERLRTAPGLVPVVVRIQPIRNLPEFLGLPQATSGMAPGTP